MWSIFTLYVLKFSDINNLRENVVYTEKMCIFGTFFHCSSNYDTLRQKNGVYLFAVRFFIMLEEVIEVIDVNKSILKFKESCRYEDYCKVLTAIVVNDFYLVRMHNDADDFSYSYIRDNENMRWLNVYTSLRQVKGGKRENSVKSSFIVNIYKMLEENNLQGIIINQKGKTELKMEIGTVRLAIERFYDSLGRKF